jgi:GT2 family glycosyltransferase/spore maturation protein CgeB
MPDAESEAVPDPLATARLEELEALRRSLANRSAEAQALQRLLQARQRELEQVRGGLTVPLTALRSQLERVQRSSAWRYGHAASRGLLRLSGRRPTTAGGVAAAIGQVDRMLELIDAAPERLGASPEHDRPSGASRARGRLANREDLLLLGQEIRDRLGPPLPLEEPPPAVSLIVVSRSRERVVRLLARLEETNYPALEVILVDNASPDAEVAAIAQSETVIEIRTTRFENAANHAAASNKGATRAGSELILFLGDDVHPVEPGWLHELVSSLRDGDAEIVGATIAASRLASETASPGTGWVLAQRGVAIGMDDASLTPSFRDEGEDLLGDRFGVDTPAVAVSGACLLISQATFAALGTFDTGYRVGSEDVDLCLRARERGYTVACSGRTIVVDDGSSSQETGGGGPGRPNRAAGRRRLQQLWGPALRRDRLDGLLSGTPAWEDRPHLAIVRTSDHPHDDSEDDHTALQLGAAAAELGWRVTDLGQSDEPGTTTPADVDIALVLSGEWDAREFPASALVCAWIAHRTECWLARPWFDRYDVLLASSQRELERLAQATGRPVELFEPASDPTRFRPPRPSSERPLDWVFTGDRTGQPSRVETALVSHRGGGAIFGRGWEEMRRLRRLARDPIAYDELPDVYAMTKLVIDDATEPALEDGAVGPRVLDGIACGALVLTNAERGARELFDHDFPTWSSAEQLDHQLGDLLATPARLSELVSRYRQTVLDRHTYGHRARRLRRIAHEHNDRLSFCLKIGAPDWEQAERWGDLHLAVGLGRALRRMGHRWRIDVVSEWAAPQSSSFDVAIHLHGRGEYQPVPGQFNVLWLISHPETFSESQIDGYDLVCAASEPFAASLGGRISTPVRVLEQATDPRIFYPDTDPALAHELVFVGNSRGVRRKILDDLLPTARDLAVWGGGWQGTTVERHLLGEHLPNHELRKAYSSAAIVLCDHWPDMRDAGFRSNRLYDALACGALVVSDRVAGLDGSFGEAVLTYEDPSELDPLLERLVADPAERARCRHGARDRILSGETFDDRARDLLAWVQDSHG